MTTNARRTRAPVARAPLFAALIATVAAGACDLPTSPPRFQPTFVVETAPVTVPVTSTPASSFVARDLADLDPDVAARARSGALVVSVDNAVAARGSVRVRVAGGGATVEGDIALDAAGAGRIDIPEDALRAFLSDAVVIHVSGTLCPASGCVVRPPPFPEVTFRPRLEIVFEIGGAGA